MEQWIDTEKELSRLAEKALHRYLEQEGVLWIFDYIPGELKSKILDKLTPSERREFMNYLAQRVMRKAVEGKGE